MVSTLVIFSKAFGVPVAKAINEVLNDLSSGKDLNLLGNYLGNISRSPWCSLAETICSVKAVKFYLGTYLGKLSISLSCCLTETIYSVKAVKVYLGTYLGNIS